MYHTSPMDPMVSLQVLEAYTKHMLRLTTKSKHLSITRDPMVQIRGVFFCHPATLVMVEFQVSGQIIATFPAGWSPQMVVKSKGIPSKSP